MNKQIQKKIKLFKDFDIGTFESVSSVANSFNEFTNEYLRIAKSIKRLYKKAYIASADTEQNKQKLTFDFKKQFNSLLRDSFKVYSKDTFDDEFDCRYNYLDCFEYDLINCIMSKEEMRKMKTDDIRRFDELVEVKYLLYFGNLWGYKRCMDISLEYLNKKLNIKLDASA